MDPCGGVRGARTSGDEADARAACQLAIRLGHHCGAAFLAGVDDLDFGVVHRVQRGEIAFAGDAEYAVHALCFEAIDQ